MVQPTALKRYWAEKNKDSIGRKKGDKFFNKPYITNGGHNMKTGYETSEVLDARIKHGKDRIKTGESSDLVLKSGHVWSVKQQKFIK